MKLKMFSFERLSLIRKVSVAAVLISIMPLIVLGSMMLQKTLPPLVIALVGVNILLGWGIIFEVILAITRLLRQAKEVINISYDDPDEQNEVRILGAMFNRVSGKIKGSFDQLREVTAQANQLNRDIMKKMSISSAVLQANSIASESSDISQALSYILGSMKEITGTDAAVFFLREGKTNIFQLYANVGIKKNLQGIEADKSGLDNLIEGNKKILVDARHPARGHLQNFIQAQLMCEAMVFAPIALQRKVIGFLAIGSMNKNFIFPDDDLESLDIFTQSISLLWEERLVKERIRELDIRDPLTGLYSEQHIHSAFIAAMNLALERHTPCGFILLRVYDFQSTDLAIPSRKVEYSLKKVSDLILAHLDIFDKAGRIGDEQFAIIVPKKSKSAVEKKSSDIITDINEFISSNTIGIRFSVASAVVESPIDGVSAEELLRKAQQNLR